MRDLPGGTVTLLFTDIEGSTRLLHELGERYAQVLAEHRRLLRDAFSRHGGIEVDTQGDAFFFAFARASDGVSAARDAQDALAGGPVRVRIGIHTGEPVVTDEGYVGVDVHQAARVLGAAEDFPDGVFWVPLQALRDHALVERAIGASVEADGGLIEHVGSKRLLVLLDNFEQVVEAAPVVSALLAGTPNAKVLVTSREPLDIDPEHRFPVDPLPVDDAAVLFVERARAVSPGFQPAAAVGEICNRLDGLPLAIELAAARIALLDADELLTRLDRRLPLLASRSRDAPARQRTLRATIEWSYELLGPEEQALFRRLAVFRGSFTLEAAEAVCGADLAVLESLVVKSLVRRWGSGRLGMLDTIREYALERLDESRDVEDVHRRHADFFLAAAESANLDASRDRGGGQRLDIAFAEQDNVRGALQWTIVSGNLTLGLELATAVEQFWVANDPREGVRWFGTLLEHPQAEAVPLDVRGGALRAWGSSAYIAGRPDLAAQLFTQSLAVYDELGDQHNRAVLLHRLGLSALHRGDLDRAKDLVDESHRIHEQRGTLWGQTQTVGSLGAIAREAGEPEQALELIAASAEMADETGHIWWEGGMYAELAALLLDRGRVEEAEARARASLEIADRIRDRSGRIFGVGLLARVAAERGECERAGRLWGAIEEEDAHAPLGGWRRHRQACEERMRQAEGPEFDRGREEGRTLTLDDAVSLALGS